MKKAPSLRYYARFRCAFGYLRCLITLNNSRKYITTPLVIKRRQLPLLHSEGYLDIVDPEDMGLNLRLQEYDKTIREYIDELLADGTFYAAPSWPMTTAIEIRHRDKQRARRRRLAEREGIDTSQMPPEAFDEGTWYNVDENRKMTLQERAEFKNQLSKYNEK